ncbi:hypothetical protein K7X08_002087 [Anisodus acutangulus]|uniref:Uncharacterized protein n=1 Tax=Anisodus acutangulus TaxID=402998 RepID=A0A9Q1LNK0_9SOLA|nr:hypothetical protein K7X08_002087 [Anisodus acutangulus]
MDENLSRMRRRLDNMQNSLSVWFQKLADDQARPDVIASLADKCETEEVAEPEISSALDDDNSNSEVHPEMLEPPTDVEKENLENASNYLSLGPSGPLLIPIETVDADDFATDAKDGAATGSKGGEHHLFDEFPQRNELVYLQPTLLHIQLDVHPNILDGTKEEFRVHVQLIQYSPLPSFNCFVQNSTSTVSFMVYIMALYINCAPNLNEVFKDAHGFQLSFMQMPIHFVFRHKKFGDHFSAMEFDKNGYYPTIGAHGGG